MSGIRGKDTGPEMLVRKALFHRGLRYRLHFKGLPGKPDIVFPQYRAIVLVHGCFWHMHQCKLFKWPATRVDFWREKLLANRSRDVRNLQAYNELGWKTLVIWECAVRKYKQHMEDLTDQVEDWVRRGTGDKMIE